MKVDKGKVRQVTFTNIPSFVYRREVEVQVEGIGQVTLDIAYGGNFYGIVEAASIGLALEQSHGAKIVRTAVQIREAVNAVVEVVHPENPVIQGLTHIEFYGEPVAPQVGAAMSSSSHREVSIVLLVAQEPQPRLRCCTPKENWTSMSRLYMKASQVPCFGLKSWARRR